MEKSAFTPEQVAQRWDCSVGTIRQLISSGKIPSFRVGRLMRVPASVITAMEVDAQ